MTKKKLLIDGKIVYYWERNPSAKRVLVLVHGFRGNHKGLTALSANLGNYRIIAPDLPGYGISEPMSRRHNFKNYAEFLYKFFKALKLTDFDLIGHSYGASIAIYYAAEIKKKMNKLVLISPVVGEGDRSVDHLAKAFFELAERLPHALQHRLLASKVADFLSAEFLIVSVSPKQKQKLRLRGRENLKELRDHVVIESYLSFHNTKFYALAKKIKAQTFIISGLVDPIADIDTQKKLASIINSCRMRVIPDVGHLAPLEEPKTVAKLILKFLREKNK